MCICTHAHYTCASAAAACVLASFVCCMQSRSRHSSFATVSLSSLHRLWYLLISSLRHAKAQTRRRLYIRERERGHRGYADHIDTQSSETHRAQNHRDTQKHAAKQRDKRRHTGTSRTHRESQRDTVRQRQRRTGTIRDTQPHRQARGHTGTRITRPRRTPAC